MELELERLRLAWRERIKERGVIEAYAKHIQMSMELLKLKQNDNLSLKEQEGSE